LQEIGFYLPGELPSTRLLLHLPGTPQTTEGTIPARVVRLQTRGEGWCEVGVVRTESGT
jgi:hypothetical protein